MNKVAIVTGGSSGIGKATASALSEKGYTVYEFSRHGEDYEGVRHIFADVTDEKSVAEAFRDVFDREGRIDVLVNNAGFGISGAVEFTDLDDAKRQFDVNFFGQFICCKAVIPYMRDQKSGTIINVSSVAAPVPIPFQAFYSASKAAVSSFTASLANEVRMFGIKVRAVLPGDIKTGFTSARKKNIMGDDIYGGVISNSVSHMEKDEKNGMSAESAGRYIAGIAARKHGRIYYTIRMDYKILVFIANVLPDKAVNALLRILYFK